ncbi:MAG: hypothetical protein GPOALKHO_000878 [Sodalis sp.]|nr:MAG: hypothetical protein GPOALKHO_000878 [Sodalis sp.]
MSLPVSGNGEIRAYPNPCIGVLAPLSPAWARWLLLDAFDPAHRYQYLTRDNYNYIAEYKPGSRNSAI